MTSVRQKILQQLDLSLQRILVANNYETNAGANVKTDFVPLAELNNFPVCYAVLGPDKAESEGEGQSRKVINNQYVTVTGFIGIAVQSNSSTAKSLRNEIEKAVSDLYQFFKHSDATKGISVYNVSEVVNIEPGQTSPYMVDDNTVSAWVIRSFTIKFKDFKF